MEKEDLRKRAEKYSFGQIGRLTMKKEYYLSEEQELAWMAGYRACEEKLEKVRDKVDSLIEFFEDESMENKAFVYMVGGQTKHHKALAYAFKEFRKDMFPKKEALE